MSRRVIARSALIQRHLSSAAPKMAISKDKLAFLHDYSACDVSDALLKLQKPAAGKPARAGYLADVVPYAPSSPFSHGVEQRKVIAPISTLKLVDKTATGLPSIAADSPQAIPKGSHWSDVTESDTVLVIEQPSHQTCAAIGGIMASRMKVRGVAGCVVSGRVRDLAELTRSDLPIWATGRSTVGQGGEAKVYARNVQLVINDVEVHPGDVAFCDPLEGVVVIPEHLIDQVIELMPKLVAADDKVKEDVANGSSVQEAFEKHRE